MVASMLKALLKESVPDLRKINHATKKIMLRPKLQKTFFKLMIKIWSEDEDSRRILAFINILKGLDCNPESTPLCIKMMYLAYVRNCKFVLGSTLPHINFMRHSFLELLSQRLDEAYVHAFAYIRQLAIGLRKAYTSHSKEDTQAVQNWQFIYSLRLWSDLVAKHANSHQLIHSLLHPLVQLIVATVKLNPAERWIPLRFHCVEMLHVLAGVPYLLGPAESIADAQPVACNKSIPLAGSALFPSRRVLVPSLPLLLDTFQLVNFNRRAPIPSNAPLDLRLVLHFSPSQRRETASLDAVISWLIDLLTEAAAIQANSVVFPEYALPLIHSLKTFIHTCRVSAFTRSAKALLLKVREHSDWIQSQRRRVRNLGSSNEINQFETNLTILDGSVSAPPFWVFYVNHKQLRTSELAQLTKCHQKNLLAHDGSGSEHATDRKKIERQRFAENSSEDSADSDSSDASYDVDDGITVTHVSKSKKNSPYPATSTSTKKAEQVEAASDENDASDDSDFDLETALNEPEANDESELDELAPDQLTDFELSDSESGTDKDDDESDCINDNSSHVEDDDTSPQNARTIRWKSNSPPFKSQAKNSQKLSTRTTVSSGMEFKKKTKAKRSAKSHPRQPMPKKLKLTSGTPKKSSKRRVRPN